MPAKLLGFVVALGGAVTTVVVDGSLFGSVCFSFSPCGCFSVFLVFTTRFVPRRFFEDVLDGSLAFGKDSR